MGTPTDPGAVTEVQGGNSDVSDAPGPNPAWNDVLNVLPEQFHSVVTPHFQKWDDAANQRIESVNSQLKTFQDYQPFVEHGITAKEIENGLRLVYEINNNPQNVYDSLAKAYNFGQQQQQTAQKPSTQDNDEGDENNAISPEILQKLQGQEGILQAVAQIVLNDARAKRDAQADAELDKELSSLQAEYGDDYNERYVLAMMQNGMSGKEACDSFKEMRSSLSPQPFAPNVLGSSGGGSGVPSQAIDPTKLSGKETRNLVAQMLEQAARQQ